MCWLIASSVLAGCATATPLVEMDASGADSSSIDAPRDAAPTDSPPTDSPPIDAPMVTCTMPFTGALATWDFTGDAGSQLASSVDAMAPGVVASSVTRASGVTAVAGVNSLNSSSWPTASSLDSTKYVTFSVTPPAGCTLSITTVAVDAKASGSGPTAARIATSVDAYAQLAPISTAAASVGTLNVSAAPAAVELRIYGFSASSAAGTLRLQASLVVNGSVQ